MKGVKPVLRLTTRDGAIFENSDPLSSAFAENSALSSTVLEWIMPPLTQRYMETCVQHKISKALMSNFIDRKYNHFCIFLLQFFRC